MAKGENRLCFTTETKMMMKVCEQIDDQELLPEPSFLPLRGERCVSEPREHGGMQISNSVSGESHLPELLPLSFANPHVNLPLSWIQATQTWLDGGRIAKTRNSFHFTIFLGFSNCNVSMTYK